MYRIEWDGKLTVTEMLDDLICVDACLWKVLVVALDVVLTSPFRRSTKSPAGTLVNVTRKFPSPSGCRRNRQKRNTKYTV